MTKEIIANLDKLQELYKTNGKNEFVFLNTRWKELFYNYLINEYGHIVSFHKNSKKLLKNSHTNKKGYIINSAVCPDTNRKNWGNHQLVAIAFLNYPKKVNRTEVIDHIDRNRKNNHVSNLRIVSWADNARNRTKEGESASRTNISWSLEKRKWKAYISYNKKQIHLGYFNSEEEAIPWINEALKKINENKENEILSKKRTPKVQSKGVVLAANGRYGVSFTHKRKGFKLASFPTEETAYNAYLTAKANLQNGLPLDFGINREPVQRKKAKP